MVKVYDSLVSPVERRPSAMSVSMCCYERFNVLLLAFQCVAVSVSMSCYERYGLALLLTLQRYYILEGRCPTLSDRREIFLKFCSSSHDLRMMSEKKHLPSYIFHLHFEKLP